MSSPASRKRQRHRRRADEKIWAAQARLADREIDLAAYDRVLADMNRRFRAGTLSPFSGAQALSVVTVLRGAIAQERDRLAAEEAELVVARAKLSPPSDPRETIVP